MSKYSLPGLLMLLSLSLLKNLKWKEKKGNSPSSLCHRAHAQSLHLETLHFTKPSCQQAHPRGHHHTHQLSSLPPSMCVLLSDTPKSIEPDPKSPLSPNPPNASNPLYAFPLLSFVFEPGPLNDAAFKSSLSLTAQPCAAQNHHAPRLRAEPPHASLPPRTIVRPWLLRRGNLHQLNICGTLLLASSYSVPFVLIMLFFIVFICSLVLPLVCVISVVYVYPFFFYIKIIVAILLYYLSFSFIIFVSEFYSLCYDFNLFQSINFYVFVYVVKLF